MNTEEKKDYNSEYYKFLYQQLEETNRIVQQVDDLSSQKIGEEYFQSIVNGLSNVLEADYVLIVKVSSDFKIGEVLYISAKGQTAEVIHYELAGTPCFNVFNNNVCVYPEGVQQLFPQDLLLIEMEIEAYAGIPIPIRNEQKAERWILVTLFSKKLQDKNFYEHILRLFAQKIQSERERFNLLNIIKKTTEDGKRFRDTIFKLTLDQDVASGNQSRLFAKITEALCEALGTSRAGIWMFENDNKKLVCVDLYEANIKQHGSGNLLVAKDYPRYFHAILEDHCIYADDALNDLRTIEFKEGYLLPLGITSMLDIGITVRGKLVGVICTEHTDKQRNWTNDEVIFVNTISSLVENTIISSEYIALNQEYLAQNKALEELIDISKEGERVANFGTWKWSAKTNQVIWSDNLCAMHGILPNAFDGTFEMTLSFIHEEDQEMMLQQIYEMLDKKLPTVFEYRMQTSNGQIKWLEGVNRFYYDEKGEVTALLGCIRDITIQKLKEKELLDSEVKYKNLFDNIKDGMCILDTKGNILHHNKAFSQILGYDEADLKSIKIPDIVHPEQHDISRTQLTKLKEKGNYTGYETRVISKDGSIVWIQVNSNAIYDENGVFVGSNDIIRDVTERKKTEIALQKVQEVLEETSRVAKVGGWDMDLNTRKLYWTDVAREIHEIPLDYDLSLLQSPDFLKNEVDRKKAMEATQRTMQTGEPYDLEFEIITAKGNLAWVRIIGKGEFKDGKCFRLYGAIQDITERKKAEIELHKIKEILEETSQVARIGGWELDLIKKEVFWTNVVKEIYEVPLDYEPTTTTARDFLKEGEHKEKLILANIKALTTGEPYDLEFNIITAKGNEIWVRSIGKPEMKDGTCIRIYGAIQDVTKEKQLENELAKANETEFAKLYHQQKVYSAQIEQKSKELDRFFELSLDLICILDKNGATQRINPAFAKTLGYSEAEILTKSLSSFRHPDDYEISMAAIEKMSVGEAMTGFINRYITKDGDIRIFSWHTVQDPDTELTYAIARDITEERKVNRQIEDLKYTLDQTAIVMIVGGDEKIISVNDKFCEVSGYAREEVIGQHHNILDSRHHSDAFWVKLKATIESGKIWQGEIKERAKDGSFYWTHTSTVPFADERGKVSQYIVTQFDITTRKQLEIDLRKAEEQATQNAKIKEDFLSNMSHEIRTPMNAVLGFSRLLLQTGMDKKQYDYAHAIYTSAENLLVIVNDILDFSKMESGKFEVEKVAFDLAKTIHSTANTLRTSIENKNIQLFIEIDSNIPSNIISAPNRITQVLLNLMGNALKFTKEGYIKLKVNLKSKNLLLFEVEDTGIGIAQDKLDLIFESFTQAENYTTRMYGGTGLGLSISKKLVTLLGGEIAVKSQLGKGSTFFFTLPFIVADAIETQEQDNKQVPTLSITNAKLLVVDDNRLNRELVSIYLNMLNCSFDLAINGQEALQFVSKNKYDLILMDIQMPVMDGLESTIMIRQQDKKTPIVAMTAHALAKEKQRCFDIGMNDYLAKPFRKEDLESILIKHITGQVEVSESSADKANLVKSMDLVLDINRLKEEVGEDVEMIQHVLNLFKDEIQHFVKNIQESIAAEDVKNLGQLAHKIKPNFQLFKLDSIANILNEIERLAVLDNHAKEIYEYCNEILKYMPGILLQIAEERNLIDN